MRRPAGTLAAQCAGRPGTRVVPDRRAIQRRPGPARSDGGAERGQAPTSAFPGPVHGAAGTALRHDRPSGGHVRKRSSPRRGSVAGRSARIRRDHGAGRSFHAHRTARRQHDLRSMPSLRRARCRAATGQRRAAVRSARAGNGAGRSRNRFRAAARTPLAVLPPVRSPPVRGGRNVLHAAQRSPEGFRHPARPAQLPAAARRARRASCRTRSAGAARQSAQFASMPELQEALSALQALPSRNAAPQPGARLSGDLMAQLRRASRGNAVQLQPEHRDALDLVGLLYDQLLTETRTEGIAQQLLGSLQVPLLRIALSDSNFFTVRNHPARRLLNLVLETANLWLDRSDEKFDNALNQRLQRSVKRVVEDNTGDMAVIEKEADDLDTHLKLISRRAEIAERRQVEAAQGRDRLQDARALAAKAIDARLSKHKTSPLVRTLLENAWSDALTLTLLRDGERSEAYHRRLAAVDQLLGAPTGRDNVKLAADFNHGLTQVGLQANEADQITRYALELPQDPP